MEKNRLGTTDIQVSSLCLGTMMYGDQINDKDAFEQMDACFDRGINFFDTAELYTIPPKPETRGNSERIVGEWIKARGVRDKIILASKVTGRSPMTWIRDGEHTRLNRDQIIKAVDRSLKILQTDYIDLYQLHWPDREIQLFGGGLYTYRHYSDDYVAYEETLGALNDLCLAGKIRHVGLSNETPYGTMKFLQAAKEHNFPRMQSIQNSYTDSLKLALQRLPLKKKLAFLPTLHLRKGFCRENI